MAPRKPDYTPGETLLWRVSTDPGPEPPVPVLRTLARSESSELWIWASVRADGYVEGTIYLRVAGARQTEGERKARRPPHAAETFEIEPPVERFADLPDSPGTAARRYVEELWRTACASEAALVADRDRPAWAALWAAAETGWAEDGPDRDPLFMEYVLAQEAADAAEAEAAALRGPSEASLMVPADGRTGHWSVPGLAKTRCGRTISHAWRFVGDPEEAERTWLGGPLVPCSRCAD